MPDFGILIVTLRRRRPYLARLMRRLAPQLTSRVEVFTLEDEGAETIGRKRQRMLESEEAKGCSYLCFVDDDDLVSESYVSDILVAIESGPDVVGFKTRYYENGKYRGDGLLSVTAESWRTVRGSKGGVLFLRTPNHLSPVRKEMALAAGFPDLQTGEDAAYSRALAKLYPNMRESFVDEYLYHYLYRGCPKLRKEGEHIEVPDVVFA